MNRPMFDNVPDSMMYRNADGAPWHGNGIGVDEAPTPEAALALAGQDFDVGSVPVLGEYPLGAVTIPGYKALVRLDDAGMPAEAPWAVVSNRYTPVQNAEVADFLAALRDVGDVRIHTAGVFHGGRKCWWMADVGGAEVVPGDKVRHNAFVVNAHDGSMSLHLGLTSVRIVCWNTCQHALAEAKGKGQNFTIRHVGDVVGKMEDAARALGLVQHAADRVTDLYRDLAATGLTATQVDDILVQTFAGDSTRAQNVRGRVADLYASSPTIAIPGVAGTAWGLFNAVTEYVDHFAGATKTQADRLFSGWFGGGADAKADVVQAIRVVTAKPVGGPVVLSV